MQAPNQVRTYVASSPQLISNVDISYAQQVRGATVRITSDLVPSEDRLLFNNLNGITGSYNSATGVLTLTGSAPGTAYASGLKSVQYSNLAADPSNGDPSFSVQVGPATYSTSTGHYYELISTVGRTSLTWSQAQSDASSRNSLGLTGYLATITSAAEQNFVYSTFGGTYLWLGAADYTTANTWQWKTGPEANQSFSSNGSPY